MKGFALLITFLFGFMRCLLNVDTAKLLSNLQQMAAYPVEPIN